MVRGLFNRRRFAACSIAMAIALAATACSRGATSPSAQDSGGTTPVPGTPFTTPLTPDVDPVERFGAIWKTDFSKRSVALSEVEYLGLSRIPISSADALVHESVEEASQRLSPLEPVIVVEVSGEVRAYPQSKLIFVATEVVNDTLGGVPIAVTW